MALHYKSMHKHLEVVNLLLDRSAQPRSCRITQCEERPHPMPVQIMRAKGIATNNISESWTPAMDSAAGMGKLEVVQLLLTWGARMPVSKLALTALHSVSICNHVKVIRRLLKLEVYFQSVIVNTDSANSTNGTVLSCAARTGNIEILEVLLRYQADPGLQPMRGKSALRRAGRWGRYKAHCTSASNGRLEVVNRLPQWGADRKQRN